METPRRGTLPKLSGNEEQTRLHRLLQYAQIDNYAREAAFRACHAYADPAVALHQMKLRGVPAHTQGALEEILTADK